MKGAIKFVVLACLAIGQIHAQDLKAVDDARKACGKQFNLPEATMKRVESTDFPPYDELKCFSQCVANKVNTLNKDGSFNLDVINKILESSKNENLKAIVNKCLKEKGSDECETIYKTHKCYAESVYKK